MNQVLKPRKGYNSVQILFRNFEEIPNDWNTLPLSNLIKSGNQGVNTAIDKVEYVDSGIPIIKSKDIQTKLNLKSCDQISFNSFNKIPSQHKIQKNDVLYSNIGSVGQAIHVDTDKKSAIAWNVFLIRPNEHVNSKYLAYFLNFTKIKNILLSSASQTTMLFITKPILLKLNIFSPNLPEQQKIVNILSNVDNLINSTQKIIDQNILLKKGLMQKLLTRGINHTKFKKVNFHFGKIIEIPEDWEVKQLKEYVSKIGSGVTPNGGSSVYLKKGIPLIRSQNVHFEGLSLDNVAFISEEIHNDMKNTQLMEYDVLLNITGASIGRCTYIPTNFGEGNVNQHVCIIRPKAKLFYSFLAYVLSSNLLQNIIQSSQVGLSREGLNFKEIGDFVFPLPPLPEQQKITSILSNIDSQIQSQTKYKEKLEKLKKSLMQKLLTGQVRVIA